MSLSLPTALAIVAALGAAFGCWMLVQRSRAERAEFRRVLGTFARYVPRSIVKELLERKDEKLFAGRDIRATILVCKIWGFDRLVDTMTPEETLRYLNEFYAIAGSSIERQRGVILRFLDDGLVGIFGVPLDDPSQEDHALRAAINIVRLVAVMREKWLQTNRAPLRVGVGINSGDVIAGDAGFAERREYAIIGSPVAFAHRLAAATFELNASIIASEDTVGPVRDLYNLVAVSGVPVAAQRSLLDASIVRGRKTPDPLTLPRAGAFANTSITDGMESMFGELEQDEFSLPAASSSAPTIQITAPAAPAKPAAPPAPPQPISSTSPTSPVANAVAQRTQPQRAIEAPRAVPKAAPPKPPQPAPAAAAKAPELPLAVEPPAPPSPPPPPPPAETASPVLKTRPVAKPAKPATPVKPLLSDGDLYGGFDIPELRMPRFDGTDEGPAMPDPPPPRATYEDSGGPPLPL